MGVVSAVTQPSGTVTLVFTDTARPTVSQVLREEEKRGTIELARGKTRVVDLDGLPKRAR